MEVTIERKKEFNHKIIALNSRIKNGVYEFDKANCFCGSSDSQTITEHDRYGIFYTLKLCNKCGVIYANPRMSDESTKKFYEEEYRGIYDFGLDREEEKGKERKHAEFIKDLLDGYEAEFDVVFDIGCNRGEYLEVFDGSEIYGIDYDINSIGEGQRKGLPVTFGGIEHLEKLNKKADVIILNHVLEHFTDIENELERISRLLKPGGFLFVGLPGLYSFEVDSLYQNVHNWQFNSRTLTYVMECCGFQSWYCDPIINSLWKYTGEKRKKSNVYEGEVEEIINFAFKKKQMMPTVLSHCKWTLKNRNKNTKNSLARKWPDLRQLYNKYTDEQVVIMAGGPTIDDFENELKKLKKEGAVIVCIERMMQWAVSIGVVPDYVITMDLHSDVMESFHDLHPDINFIVHSNCNPVIFDVLADQKKYIFSSEQLGLNHGPMLKENNYDESVMINTGGSVSLACFSIAIYMGLKNFHIFGFDCHVTKSFYAKGITGVGTFDDEKIYVTIDGKDFDTTATYLVFAQQFFDLFLYAKQEDLVDDLKLYGNSMINAMTKVNLNNSVLKLYDKKGN